MAKNVKIYTTPTCGYCKLVKEYFGEHNIEYSEIDVAKDPAKAQEMIRKSGQMGVPVISVEEDGKEKLLIGYSKARLDEIFS